MNHRPRDCTTASIQGFQNIKLHLVAKAPPHWDKPPQKNTQIWTQNPPIKKKPFRRVLCPDPGGGGGCTLQSADMPGQKTNPNNVAQAINCKCEVKYTTGILPIQEDNTIDAPCSNNGHAVHISPWSSKSTGTQNRLHTCSFTCRWWAVGAVYFECPLSVCKQLVI